MRVALASVVLLFFGVAVACGTSESTSLPRQDAAAEIDAAADTALDTASPSDAPADAPKDTGTEAGWPTCVSPTATAAIKSIGQVWGDDPQVESETWIDGVYVTAVSKNGCVTNQACQIFL